LRNVCIIDLTAKPASFFHRNSVTQVRPLCSGTTIQLFSF
jgi:hypothetical protein